MEREITPELALRVEYLGQLAVGIRAQLEQLVPLIAASEAQLAADRELLMQAEQAQQSAAAEVERIKAEIAPLAVGPEEWQQFAAMQKLIEKITPELEEDFGWWYVQTEKRMDAVQETLEQTGELVSQVIDESEPGTAAAAERADAKTVMLNVMVQLQAAASARLAELEQQESWIPDPAAWGKLLEQARHLRSADDVAYIEGRYDELRRELIEAEETAARATELIGVVAAHVAASEEYLRFRQALRDELHEQLGQIDAWTASQGQAAG